VRKAGGKIYAEPGESQGWMYAFGFEDLDGHRWSMLYMDISKMPGSIKQTITVETTIHAPVRAVWEFFTKPENIVKWNHASEDWECLRAENDIRVGGRFMFRMSVKDGSTSFDFTGTYTAVNPQKSLSYTIDDGRKVTVTFRVLKDHVQLGETFEKESEHSVEQQYSGWQSILNNFKKFVESRNSSERIR
jgi:uncharacterized protein YndB with AHSA1/START domain